MMLNKTLCIFDTYFKTLYFSRDLKIAIHLQNSIIKFNFNIKLLKTVSLKF